MMHNMAEDFLSKTRKDGKKIMQSQQLMTHCAHSQRRILQNIEEKMWKYVAPNSAIDEVIMFQETERSTDQNFRKDKKYF